MTSRGIFERALYYSYLEFAVDKPSMKFNAADILQRIGSLLEKDTPPKEHDIFVLYKIFYDCNIRDIKAARDIYSKLSLDIHG